MIYEKFIGFVSSKDLGIGAQMNICTHYGQMYICSFEVRHPCCVNQITYMVDVQSKHNYIIS